MIGKTVILAVLCTLVDSNAVYTVYKNAMVGTDGQTCEDNLQVVEGTYFNQSIYSARLEERLDWKDLALQYEKEICDLKLHSTYVGNSNLEEKVMKLERENRELWEIVRNYSQISENLSGFVPLPSLSQFAFTDCGELTGASILDILQISNKRYFTPNPTFYPSFHTHGFNWTQAYNYCNNCGLKLASFETQQEFDELDNYFKTTYKRFNLPPRYSTGAYRHRNGTHDIFTWSNGQTVNLSNDSYYEINNQISDQVVTISLYLPWSENPNDRTLMLKYGSSSEAGAPLCE